MAYDEGLVPLFTSVQFGRNGFPGESNPWAQWQYMSAFATQVHGTGQYGKQYSPAGAVGPALSARQPGTWPPNFPPGVVGTMQTSAQEASYMLEPGVVPRLTQLYGLQVPQMVPATGEPLRYQNRSTQRGAMLRRGSYPNQAEITMPDNTRAPAMRPQIPAAPAASFNPSVETQRVCAFNERLGVTVCRHVRKGGSTMAVSVRQKAPGGTKICKDGHCCSPRGPSGLVHCIRELWGQPGREGNPSRYTREKCERFCKDEGGRKAECIRKCLAIQTTLTATHRGRRQRKRRGISVGQTRRARPSRQRCEYTIPGTGRCWKPPSFPYKFVEQGEFCPSGMRPLGQTVEIYTPDHGPTGAEVRYKDVCGALGCTSAVRKTGHVPTSSELFGCPRGTAPVNPEERSNRWICCPTVASQARPGPPPAMRAQISVGKKKRKRAFNQIGTLALASVLGNSVRKAVIS